LLKKSSELMAADERRLKTNGLSVFIGGPNSFFSTV